MRYGTHGHVAEGDTRIDYVWNGEALRLTVAHAEETCGARVDVSPRDAFGLALAAIEAASHVPRSASQLRYWLASVEAELAHEANVRERSRQRHPSTGRIR